MSRSTAVELEGRRGRIALRAWPNDDARLIVLIAHGYGEHIGRYQHVADHLAGEGAAVYGHDQLGHGESEGERVLIEDVEDLVADLATVAEHARSEYPGLPIVLIGHSMGGIVATRYAQQHGDELAALVLSGPVIGGNPEIEALLGMDPMPEVPVDPAILSRDPAVGRAYTDDPLVWHGPFKRPTLEALFASIEAIAAGGSLGTLPTLWVHGEQDELAPLAETRAAIERLRGSALEQTIYPGARHEVFNEINRDEVLGEVSDFIGRSLARSD